jgi:hypothetical protein
MSEITDKLALATNNGTTLTMGTVLALAGASALAGGTRGRGSSAILTDNTNKTRTAMGGAIGGTVGPIGAAIGGAIGADDDTRWRGAGGAALGALVGGVISRKAVGVDTTSATSNRPFLTMLMMGVGGAAGAYLIQRD